MSHVTMLCVFSAPESRRSSGGDSMAGTGFSGAMPGTFPSARAVAGFVVVGTSLVIDL